MRNWNLDAVDRAPLSRPTGDWRRAARRILVRREAKGRTRAGGERAIRLEPRRGLRESAALRLRDVVVSREIRRAAANSGTVARHVATAWSAYDARLHVATEPDFARALEPVLFDDAQHRRACLTAMVGNLSRLAGADRENALAA